MSLCRVSVIIPVYNGERFLQSTLMSVVNQESVDLELIIVNDGSTDSTSEILSTFKSEYPDRVSVISQENLGEAKAVNIGVAQSTGEFLVILSADDLLHQNHLLELSKALSQAPNAVVVYCDWLQIDEFGTVVREVKTLSYDIRALIADFVCIPGPGALIRRSAIPEAGLRDPRYKFVSDYGSWLRLACRGTFIRVAKPLASYRLHRGQATVIGRGATMAHEIERVVMDFFNEEFLPLPVANLRRRALGFAKYYAGLQGLTSPGVKCKRRMLQSVFLAPPKPVEWDTVPRRIILWSITFFLPKPNILWGSLTSRSRKLRHVTDR
jgi:glycosyltransferase involved in cell wall biosynthesis